MPRCSNCSAITTGVSRRCPECGHVEGANLGKGRPQRIDTAAFQPDAPDSPDSLNPAAGSDRRARAAARLTSTGRRRARREPAWTVRAVAAAVVATFAVGAATVVQAQRDPSAGVGAAPRPSPSPTGLLGVPTDSGAVLAATTGEELLTLDVDGGTVDRLDLSMTPLRWLNGGGASVAFNADRTVVAVGQLGRGVVVLNFPFVSSAALAVIEDADVVLGQTLDGTGFWVTKVDGARYHHEKRTATLHHFGGGLPRTVEIEEGIPLAVVGDQLLAGVREYPGFRLALHDTKTGRVASRLGSATHVVDADETQLAWVPYCETLDTDECPLRVDDVVAGRTRYVRAAYNGARWGTGMFSPNGRLLVAVQHRSGYDGVDVVLVHDDADLAVPVAAEDLRGVPRSFAWSASNEWVFWVSEFRGDPIGTGYELATRRAYVVEDVEASDLFLLG